ncbi:U-scoloptoxin(05)-Ssd1a-like [Neocloeon triangulifer]|uniref:U-scoloptoxin(05)-Ssd1a-like n=1 Tax=Neocloeon triangulifer TaxID=2078957 RepID=UPI00286F13DD|nr:U-scoloptoxin(05)-Ssd1a-like [Neocloeon triangulifer]
MEGRPKFALATALALAALLLVSPAQGIECVQCNSEGSLECVSSPPAAKPCPPSSKYCITVQETLVEDGALSLLTRACIPVDLGLKCQENQQSPHGDKINVCHEVCKSDGCNNEPYEESSESGAAQTSVFSSLLFSTVLLLLRQWA